MFWQHVIAVLLLFSFFRVPTTTKSDFLKFAKSNEMEPSTLYLGPFHPRESLFVFDLIFLKLAPLTPPMNPSGLRRSSQP